MTDQHIASIWEAISDEFGDDVALAHGERRVTWSEFDDRSARLASALAGAGLERGAVVAIDLFNCPEFFECFHAVLKGGFVPTMVNYRYRAGELRHLLLDAEAEVLIADPDLVEAVRAIAADLPRLHEIIVLGDDYEQRLRAHDPAPRRERGGEGMMLSYTGGTTGMPKGVVYGIPRLTGQALRTRAMVAGVDLDDALPPVAAARDLRDRGAVPVCCPASPLMHSTAFTFASLPTLTAGGTVVTLENRRFDADLLLDACDRHGVSTTAVVGDAFARPLVTALDERAAAGDPFDPRSLRVIVSAGVAFSADSKRRLIEHLPGLTITDACGSTEGATFGVSTTRAGDDPTTVTFHPAPGTIIVDAERQPLPEGEVGYVSAVTVTSGYHHQPEKTAETFYADEAGDWRVIPGDFGRIEPDGTLTLLGRGSTVINTGGEKVHPEEVEDVIKAIPGVVDVIVWAVPDERLGSLVGAVVTRVPGAAVDAEVVSGRVRSELAGYKAPRRVVFVDDIPRHPNGKLDSRRVTALLDPGQLDN